eukprot:Em0025g94a
MVDLASIAQPMLVLLETLFHYNQRVCMVTSMQYQDHVGTSLWINISGTCYTSVLTIPTPQYFNGTTVMCRDGITGTLIGNDTLNIQLATPPSAPTITSLISTYSDQLTVTWTSVPTATSYSVSINDSVNTLVPIPSTGAPQYTFTGLTNNTVYTVSVVAINCAGSSSPATITGK